MRSLLVLFLSGWCGLSAFATPGDASRYSDAKGGSALIIWQDGRIILENYRNGGSPQRPENIYSITKNLSALGAFSAAGKSRLRLDTPVAPLLPEWKSHPAKRRITLRQLLNQSSGLSPGYELYSPSLRDKDSAALRIRLTSPVGQTFAYGPSHYEVAGIVLTRGTGLSLLPWLGKSLLKPLGIIPGGWRHDRMGAPYFSAGARLRARDLLTVGHLVRRRGRVGLFPLVPSSFFKEVEAGSPANSMYGLSFWLNRNASKKNASERDIEEAISAGLSREMWNSSCLSRSAPSDLIAMVGSNGQRVYISRSQDLVIVRLGRQSGFRDPDFLRAFYK